MSFEEAPLDEGKVRVWWQAVCEISSFRNGVDLLIDSQGGRRLYNDFIQLDPGAAMQLQSRPGKPYADSRIPGNMLV